MIIDMACPSGPINATIGLEIIRKRRSRPIDRPSRSWS
jgi:hypothetical protein